MSGSPRVLLGLAAVAVAFAAADTYVVVLALPDMMESAGIPIDQLQRGAPIVSGFLLGYVAMLPLIGRMADLRGRVPVLVGALVLFAAGSLVTTAAYDLPSLVAGRFLQGVGGGGLVPATLALVADLYPVERRGVPLGVVSAVQELGSVIGPLYGALVLAISDWRVIFAVNLGVGLALAAALRALRFGSERQEPRQGPGTLDWAGIGCALVGIAAAGLVVVQPTTLVMDVTWGRLFIPVTGSTRWLTPLGLVALVAALLFLVRCWTARRPLVDLRGWWGAALHADLPGALFLAAALGGVILAFATADPRIEVFAPQGWWYLLAAAVATGVLVWHLRTETTPIVPRGALRRTPAWGSLLVSFFVGAALIAALIDIPIFARTTVYADSQLDAALVLVRFL
ncbi:MAG TPA: MFS transporter, partial [Nocardioides sp.]|nr:MFS transporter [Nocardioides sp.]